MYNHVRLLALLRGAKHIYNDVRLLFFYCVMHTFRLHSNYRESNGEWVVSVNWWMVSIGDLRFTSTTAPVYHHVTR